MNETGKRCGQEQTKKSVDNNAVNIGSGPVMQSAVDTLAMLGGKSQVVLRARGNSIPNAVAVANIVTEKMLKGNSKIEDIKLDTAQEPGIGRMLSTIEIVLTKT